MTTNLLENMSMIIATTLIHPFLVSCNYCDRNNYTQQNYFEKYEHPKNFLK